MLSRFPVDLQADRKYYFLEQNTSIITEFGEYIRQETKKALNNLLLKELLKEKDNSHITVRKCRKDLELNPDDHVANTQLGKAYLIKEKINMAIRQFKKSLEVVPNYNEALYYLAVTYYIQGKMDLAIETLNSLQSEPDPITLCIMGDIYYMSGEISDSIKYFMRAIGRNIPYVLPYIQLGNIYSFEGDLENAIKTYEQALAIEENEITNINLAFNLYLYGDMSRAINIIRRLAALLPDIPVINFTCGFLLFQGENYEEALKYYLNAIELEPSNYLFYNALGMLYFNKNDLENAAESHIKSLKYKSDYISGHIDLAFTFQLLGALDNSMTEYNEVIARKIENPLVYYNTGTLYRLKGDFDEAINYYKKAILLEPEVGLSYGGLGLSYLDKWMETQKTDNNLFMLSQENINLALKFEPSLLTARLGLGILYLESNNSTEATRHFEALLKIAPDYVPAKLKLYEIYLSMADNFYLQGKYELAIQYAEKALQLMPEKSQKSPDTTERKVQVEGRGAREILIGSCEKSGEFFYKKGMFNKALDSYKRILELEQNNPFTHIKIGLMYTIMKELKLAEKHYKMALKINPNFDNAYFNLGLLYKNKGDNVKTLECFQKYIELSPEGVHGEECREYIKDHSLQIYKVKEEKIESSYEEDFLIGWDRIASDYQSQNRISTYSVHYGPLSSGEEEIALLGDVTGKKILELGCGGGQNSIALARQGAKVMGIDFSEEQLKFARKLSEETGVAVKFLQGDIEELSFFIEGEIFDIVISSFTLSYVENIDKVFTGVRSLLRSGGILVFCLEHPFITNLQEEDFIKFQGKIYPFVKNYFETGKDEITWRSDKIKAKLPLYKRKLEDIINPLLSSGFQIVRLLEPSPYELKNMSREEIEDIPYLPSMEQSKYIFSKELPYTLLIKAIAT